MYTKNIINKTKKSYLITETLKHTVFFILLYGICNFIIYSHLFNYDSLEFIKLLSLILLTVLFYSFNHNFLKETKHNTNYKLNFILLYGILGYATPMFIGGYKTFFGDNIILCLITCLLTGLVFSSLLLLIFLKKA